jgi:cell division septum initiation protein DivIVA
VSKYGIESMEYLTRTNHHSVTPSRRGAGIPGDTTIAQAPSVPPRPWKEDVYSALVAQQIDAECELANVKARIYHARLRRAGNYDELNAQRETVKARLKSVIGEIAQINAERREREAAEVSVKAVSFSRIFHQVAREKLSESTFRELETETLRRRGDIG